MRMDEIFLKSCAPQTGLNMSAVDVRSSEHLLLSYMSLPQPWLLCVSLSQAISTAMIVMCFFVAGHFYSHDCYVFHCYRPFLQPRLLCVPLPLLGSSWCARRCEWGRWNRARADGGWLPVYCILLARQRSIKYGLAQLHFQVWKPGISKDEGGLWKRSISLCGNCMRVTWREGSFTRHPKGYAT